jgi:hypothetical protein
MMTTPSSPTSFRVRFRVSGIPAQRPISHPHARFIWQIAWTDKSVMRWILGQIIQWWREAEEDDVPSPEAYDITRLFEWYEMGVVEDDVIMLCNLLRHASDPRIRAACAAALGALEIMDALPDLVEASFDPHDQVCQFAIWAIEVLDPVWCGCRGVRNVWDFLFAALSLLPETKPRQLRMF